MHRLIHARLLSQLEKHHESFVQENGQPSEDVFTFFKMWLNAPRIEKIKEDRVLTLHVKAEFERSRKIYGSPRNKLELDSKGYPPMIFLSDLSYLKDGTNRTNG